MLFVLLFFLSLSGLGAFMAAAAALLATTASMIYFSDM